MAGPDRQFTVAELGQNLPNRTLVQRDTEAPLQFVAQIDPPPAYDTVHRGVGTRIDKLGQFGLLPHRQFRSGTWRFEIAKPGQSRGVVTVHPVPQGLTVHAAGFGRRFAVHAIEYQCKRKYPTRRRTILLPARRLAKLPSRQIKSGNRYRRPHRCRPPQKPASSQSFTDLGIPNESQLRAVGISPLHRRK